MAPSSMAVTVAGMSSVEMFVPLGYRALSFNTKMKALYCRGTTPPTCNDDACNFMDCTVYVPHGTKAAYQASPGFRLFINIVESDFPLRCQATIWRGVKCQFI